MPKILEIILTKFLTTANIKLSLPVLAMAFFSIVTYQTVQINKIAKQQAQQEQSIKDIPIQIRGQISENNQLLFEYGLDILGAWVDKMAKTQKNMVDKLPIRESEKRQMIETIDTRSETVIDKAKQARLDVQFKSILPDSLEIAVRRSTK